MEYLPAAPSSRYPPEKLFRKLFKKSQEQIPLKKSCFNNGADFIPEILQKRSLNKDVFLESLRIFQSKFFFKNFVRLPLAGVYLFCKNASPKYGQKFAKNM